MGRNASVGVLQVTYQFLLQIVGKGLLTPVTIPPPDSLKILGRRTASFDFRPAITGDSAQ